MNNKGKKKRIMLIPAEQVYRYANIGKVILENYSKYDFCCYSVPLLSESQNVCTKLINRLFFYMRMLPLVGGGSSF